MSAVRRLILEGQGGFGGGREAIRIPEYQAAADRRRVVTKIVETDGLMLSQASTLEEAELQVWLKPGR